MLFDFMTIIMKSHMLHKYLNRCLKIQINTNRYSFCKKKDASGWNIDFFTLFG